MEHPRSIFVNPLANPKGTKHECELCQKPAVLQCSVCKVTFYCGQEHQRIDWDGIHNKICEHVQVLKTSRVPFLSSEEERNKRKALRLSQQIALINLTRTTGQKLLFEKKYESAIPAALQSLKFSIDVYGISSIELVPSYLILAEASIGLNKLKKAEEYLSQAEWTVLKTPGVSNAFKSRLYRIMGQLYDAKGSYEEALRNFANDIYHASEEYGTDDVYTSGGYFHMAGVFMKMGKQRVAESHYQQVTKIWMEKLKHLAAEKLAKPGTAPGIGPVVVKKEVTHDYLDEAQEAEARQVLSTIYNYRSEEGARSDDVIPTLLLTIAYLELYLGNHKESSNLATQARKILRDHSGEDDHQLMPIIEDFLESMRGLEDSSKLQMHQHNPVIAGV